MLGYMNLAQERKTFQKVHIAIIQHHVQWKKRHSITHLFSTFKPERTLSETSVHFYFLHFSIREELGYFCGLADILINLILSNISPV